MKVRKPSEIAKEAGVPVSALTAENIKRVHEEKHLMTDDRLPKVLAEVAELDRT